MKINKVGSLMLT